jgi:iron-sulfur cluster repair protein YtfE (RIC family)
MEKYINKPVKDVIKKYPTLAQILEVYDIHCYKCNGNCLLKDIFEEHNLSMKEEMQLVAEISHVLSQ